ncbi:hypothetical protein HYV83_04980 [Candidatus Woesearchaeota archaeon]|nr:hypothetical protein [Candidatus Woesearchaeota archaeon]
MNKESKVKKETGTGENVKGESRQPQHRQSHHHERAIIKAIVVIAAVVIIGFLMARYVEHALKGKQGKNSETRSYNGFEFVKSGSFWFTEWKRDDGTQYSFEFRNAPWEVEDITVVGKADDRFKLWPTVFITHDPTAEASRSVSFVAIGAANLDRILTAVFEKNVIAACTKNVTEACSARPIATCSTNSSIIYLKVSNDTGIFLDGNCATIQGYEEGLTKAADKAMYQWLGIIKK